MTGDPTAAGSTTADRPEMFLEIAGVDKAFARKGGRGIEHLAVLDGIGFAACRGDVISIIGPSGCGKSTLLNCIAGLTSFDRGSIRLDGQRVTGPGPDRAVVFQQASLLPWRTVARNVAYGLELRREFSRREIDERVAAAIELVGLQKFRTHYPHEISGGMQQRTNVARALAVDPKLILMDEPFGALDALTKEALQDQLSGLVGHDYQTTVFITHDIAEAVFLGDRVLVMSAAPGQVVADVAVPFPRPRARSVTETEAFNAVVHDLRRCLTDGRIHDRQPVLGTAARIGGMK